MYLCPLKKILVQCSTCELDKDPDHRLEVYQCMTDTAISVSALLMQTAAENVKQLELPEQPIM